MKEFKSLSNTKLLYLYHDVVEANIPHSLLKIYHPNVIAKLNYQQDIEEEIISRMKQPETVRVEVK